jgi:hypothetical protein
VPEVEKVGGKKVALLRRRRGRLYTLVPRATLRRYERGFQEVKSQPYKAVRSLDQPKLQDTSYCPTIFLL